MTEAATGKSPLNQHARHRTPSQCHNHFVQVRVHRSQMGPGVFWGWAWMSTWR